MQHKRHAKYHTNTLINNHNGNVTDTLQVDQITIPDSIPRPKRKYQPDTRQQQPIIMPKLRDSRNFKRYAYYNLNCKIFHSFHIDINVSKCNTYIINGNRILGSWGSNI